MILMASIVLMIEDSDCIKCPKKLRGLLKNAPQDQAHILCAILNGVNLKPSDSNSMRGLERDPTNDFIEEIKLDDRLKY